MSTPAEHGQHALAARLGIAHQARQISHLLDRLTVEACDHIARLNAGLLSGRIGLNCGHQSTLRLTQADRFGHVLGHRPDLHADAPARHAACSTQLIADADSLVHWNGERNPHEATRTRVDLAVDTHHLTAHINQGPSRIAGIDGHIRLDKRQVVTRIALLGADDTCGDGVLQPKWRADSHNPLAHFQATDVADLHGG